MACALDYLLFKRCLAGLWIEYNPHQSEMMKEHDGGAITSCLLSHGQSKLGKKNWQVTSRSNSFEAALFKFIANELENSTDVDAIKDYRMFLNVTMMFLLHCCWWLYSEWQCATTRKQITRMVFLLIVCIYAVQTLTAVVIRSCDTGKRVTC